MRTFKITLWTFGVGCLTGTLALPLLSFVFSRNRQPRPSFAPSAVLPDLPAVALVTALAILPVCLLVVAPLVHLLSPRSPWAQPGRAALVGALVAVVATYSFQAATRGHFYVPDLRAEGDSTLYALALTVGGVSGFACAWFSRWTLAR